VSPGMKRRNAERKNVLRCRECSKAYDLNLRTARRLRIRKNRKNPVPMAGDRGELAMMIGAPDQSHRKRF
jgi:hypothetical protein